MSTTAYGRAGYDFAGAVAVVTGGASGIGAEVAAQLRRSGARVAVWDMAEAGASDDAWQVDVSDLATVERAAAAVVARFGRIDFVVNSAGFAGPTMPLDAYDPATWRRIVDVNLVGTFNVCRAVVPHLRAAGAGRIVNIASLAARTGGPGQSHYAASKSAVVGFTRVSSMELGQHGITVNAVCPGIIQTEMGMNNLRDPERVAYFEKVTDLHRLGNPEDVVGPVAFFASDDAAFVTGQALNVDGGIFYS